MLIVQVLGANLDTSFLLSGIHSSILSKIYTLAFLASVIALEITSKLKPLILVFT